MSTKTDKIVEVCPSKDRLTSEKRNIGCSIEGCCKVFLHEGMLKMHLVKSHAQINTEADKRLFSKVQKKSTDITYIFFCPEHDCKYKMGGKHFTSFHLLKQHYMKMHAEKRFFCKKCEKGFSEQRFLRQHEEQCGNLYTCNTCPVYYTTREALQTHCKRQEHVYPEEYKRKDREKEDKRRVKKKPEATDINSFAIKGPGIPVILLTVQKQEPVISQQALPKILPKPHILTTKPTVFVPSSNPLDKELVIQHEDACSATDIANRQEVMIQTDIYGIHNLFVSGKAQNILPTSIVNNAKQTILTDTVNIGPVDLATQINCGTQYNNVFTSPSSPKGKQKAVKRKSNHSRPASPRRKRSKTTTGIQTSVSLTQKKSKRIVSATQTSGDFILKRAMAEADIPTEKRTVASQVTPQKPANLYGKTNRGTDMFIGVPDTFVKRTVPVLKDSFSQVTGLTKPMLVDSYSQVQQLAPVLRDSFSQVSSFTKPMLVDSYSQVQQSAPVLRDSFSQVSGLIKPMLVDSYSQVQQRNILAETSENVAESQTMTDLPESISTQTFDSYLGNKQYRGGAKSGKPRKGNVFNGLSKSKKTASHNTTSDKKVPKQRKKKEAIVQIYNDKLEKSITIHVPMDDPADKVQTVRDVSKSSLCDNLIDLQRKSSDIAVGNDKQDAETNKNINFTIQVNESQIKEGTSMSTQVINECLPTQITEDYSTASTNIIGTTTDMDTQAMSAQEFQKLLQSSGIYTGVSGPSNSWSTAVKLPNENLHHSNFVDIFSTGTDTIDMNTQTVSDLDLFDSISAIDMNTQTTGSGVDFLDLVMNNMETQTLNEGDLNFLGLSNNMETQTLNEDDLNSLGLSNIGCDTLDLDTSAHSLGVGTSDFTMISKGTSPRASNDNMADFRLPLGYETITHSLGIGTSDFESDSNFNANDVLLQASDYVTDKDKTSELYLGTRLKPTGLKFEGLYSDKETVQTETQTTGSETGDQLVQMEMQTQVDSTDLDFEVTNMETQTTFEELYDWLK